MKTRWGAIAAACLFLAACASARPRESDPAEPNTLTDSEKAEGWKLLFDGTTTQGWRGFRKESMLSGWQAVEGALTNAHRCGDIVTVEQYQDFDLMLEWKITKGGNSGVMYRVTEEDDAPYWTGVEYQVLDNTSYFGGKNTIQSTGAAYDLYTPYRDVTRPLGEWNTTRILVKGNHVVHWLNGHKLLEYDYGSDDWNEALAASKFKDKPHFCKSQKGHIDLQDHDGQVWYRNVKIREIPRSGEISR